MLQQWGWAQKEGEGNIPVSVEEVCEDKPVEAVNIEKNVKVDEETGRFDEKIEASRWLA